VKLDARGDVLAAPAVKQAVASAEGGAFGKGRVLLRPRATEPVVA
jgi:hypothetical protein